MKPESLASATHRTTALLQALESRIRNEGASAAPRDRPGETVEELERRLREYFTQSGKHPEPSLLERIRGRVVERVVERILQKWEEPGGSSAAGLEDEVLDRLIERVIERLRRRPPLSLNP